jgi:hypothetical protein
MIKDATSLLYDKAILELKNIGISVMDADECMLWLDVKNRENSERI